MADTDWAYLPQADAIDALVRTAPAIPEQERAAIKDADTIPYSERRPAWDHIIETNPLRSHQAMARRDARQAACAAVESAAHPAIIGALWDAAAVLVMADCIGRGGLTIDHLRTLATPACASATVREIVAPILEGAGE